MKYKPNISKFVIHPVGTTLFYCLKRQELSSKQNRSSSYLSDTLLLIQTHTLSLSVFSSQHPSPSSSLSQSLSSLSRNFTSLFSPFKSPPSPTHSVIILYVFFISLYLSSLYTCPILFQTTLKTDRHTRLLFPRRLLFPSLKDVWYPSRKAVGIRAL